MKKRYLKSINFRISIFAMFLATALIIHSCKKDNKSQTDTSSSTPVISQAKQWYETTYPTNTSATVKQTTQSINQITNTSFDYTQHLKPDWQHAAIYSRLGAAVVELPLDASSDKIGIAFKNQTTNKEIYKQQYSRSSFLLLNYGTGYQAYIMTIVADSAYLKGNLSKLANNTYRKHDADFSGVVMYFTPKGNFAGSFCYKNGQLILPASQNQASVQNVNAPKLQTNEAAAPVSCTDWYADYYLDGEYINSDFLGTTCDGGGGGGNSGGSGGNGSGSGTSGGSSGGSPVIPPCIPPQSTGTDATTTGNLIINAPIGSEPPPPTDPGDGGNPAPVQYCATTTATISIIVDSLNKNFPCAVKLIIDGLGTCGAYGNWVQPFTTARKPNLVWQNGSLPWNALNSNNQYNYELGVTAPESGSPGLGATITLNTSMLQKSSQLLISAAAVHETLHAFINYNVATAVDDKANGYMTTGSWLYGLDAWIDINGLPSNYSNHYEMLSDYFSDAVGILAQLDNNAHTTQEYAMAMLFGLDNATDGTAAQQAVLQTEYNNIMTAYGITPAVIAAFNSANLNAPSSSQLPTNCN